MRIAVYSTKPYDRRFLEAARMLIREGWGSDNPAFRQFFTAHYLPNNAVLTLAGDLEPARALALVERHFGPIPPGSDPPGPPGRTDAVALGGARAEVRGEGPLPRLYVACTVPAFACCCSFRAIAASTRLAASVISRAKTSRSRPRGGPTVFASSRAASTDP